MAVGVGACRSTWDGYGRVVLNPQLQALIAAGNFSADLGGRYLEEEQLPAGRAFAILQAKVMAGLSAHNSDLHAELEGKVWRDFATGRLCQLDGWQLSATECRLAALAFLFREDGGQIAQTKGDDSPISGLPDASIADLEGWGPRSGEAGAGFNPQADGSSALWFRFADIDDRHSYEIYFGLQPLRTSVVGARNLITATVTEWQVKRLTANPGEVPVHLVDLRHGNKQLLGRFRVQPRNGAATVEAPAAEGDENESD